MLARIAPVFCGLLWLAAATTAEAATLRLAWDPNPESDIAGYRVHYGVSSRNYTVTLDVGNRTTFAIPGLADGRRYYIAVQAYNRSGLSSALSTEVNGIAVLDTARAAANILLGQGPSNAGGGYFAIHTGVEQGFAPNAFARLPWQTYNQAGGGVRPATGDIDGDGLDEVVLGLGPRSNGWVAVLDDAAHYYTLLHWIQVPWPSYNTGNGEVFPAVGNLDSDGRAEIVLGLGDGGRGWYLIYDDANTNYRFVGWKQVTWPAYNAGPGPTHPAVGDVDNNGVAEIVIGLGRGSGGWLEVVNGAASGYSHREWIQLNWSAYNLANGTTYPALGDVDDDGRAEIVVGLGSGGAGWFAVLDDASAKFAHRSWQQVTWAAYNSRTGETHPAVGNIDGDRAAEIVLGLAEYPGGGGWFEIRDSGVSSYRSLGWRNIGWPAFTSSGGALFPAVADR